MPHLAILSVRNTPQVHLQGATYTAGDKRLAEEKMPALEFDA